jgi:hypothetical protein
MCVCGFTLTTLTHLPISNLDPNQKPNRKGEHPYQKAMSRNKQEFLVLSQHTFQLANLKSGKITLTGLG